MKYFKKLAVAALLFSAAPATYSLTPTFTYTGGDPQIASYVSQTGTTLLQQIDPNNQITNFLDNYLPNMASAASMGSKGVGTNYANGNHLFGPKIAIVGVNVGIGARFEGSSAFSLLSGGGIDPAAGMGVAPQVSVMAGLNLGFLPLPKLGPIDLKKLRVYINFGAFEVPKGLPVYGKMSNFGLHIQYSIIKPVSLIGIINWGGVDITTGFDTGKTTIGMVRQFSLPLAASGGFTASWNPPMDISLTNNFFTIPIEVSTSARLLFFSVFGGIGLDINTGKSEAVMDMTGDVIINGTKNGVASMNITETTKVSAVGLRVFFGPQINIFPLKINVQFNHDFLTKNFGVNFGLRAAI